MFTHDLFQRFHSLFGDMNIFINLNNFACTFYIKMQHISGNNYHITDIGNVNNITVTYYPYNGFEKQKHAEYFPVCYPAAF